MRPDYLKWYINVWVICARQGHGHGVSDGNFAHTRALYDVLAEIRQRYADMLIENCSGGGNRLDFGMARLTDTAWMDDRTAPSLHVRHNLEGLGTVFPLTYLLSFVLGEQLPDEVEPEPAPERAGAESSSAGTNARDCLLLFRSRMPGVLGLGDSAVVDGDTTLALREVEVYRRVREIQTTAGSFMLTEQAAAASAPRSPSSASRLLRRRCRQRTSLFCACSNRSSCRSGSADSRAGKAARDPSELDGILAS